MKNFLFKKLKKKHFQRLNEENGLIETILNPISIIKAIISDPTYKYMQLFVNSEEFILYNRLLGIYDLYTKTSFTTGISYALSSIGIDYSLSKITAIINHFNISLVANIGSIDKFFFDNYIVFTNGTYNTKTKTFGAHSHSTPCFFSLPFPWSNNSKPLVTLQYLWEFSNFDGVMLIGLRCLLHQFLTSDISTQMFGHLQGPGSAGKSTFLLLMSALVGSNAIASTSLSALSSNQFELINLRGKRLILISDADDCRTGNFSAIKSITGGDLLSGRMKYIQQPCDFYASGWLMIATNNLIFDADESGAMDRRNLRFPTVNVSKFSTPLLEFNKQTSKYSGALSVEFNQIINWALELNSEICSRFLKNTYQKYDQNKDDISLHITVKNFVKLYVEPTSEGGVFLSGQDGLFEKYLDYQASDPSDSTHMTLKNFSRLLVYALNHAEIRFVKTTKHAGTYFARIALVEKKSLKLTLRPIDPLKLEDFNLLTHNCHIELDLDSINLSLKTGVQGSHVQKKVDFNTFSQNIIDKL